MKMKKVLIYLVGMVVFSFSFSVSAQEQIKTNTEGLLKSDCAIDKIVVNYSMNFINEQIARYPKVKEYFKNVKIGTFDDFLNNFKQIIEVIKTAKEEWGIEKVGVLKDWDNFIKSQEFQNQYIEHLNGEIKTKKNMNASAQEIEKLEKDLKDFNGERFKKFSDVKKQDIINEMFKTKSEIVVLREMLGNEDLLKKGEARFKEVLEKSGYPKENFIKDMEEVINR